MKRNLQLAPAGILGKAMRKALVVWADELVFVRIIGSN